MARATINVFQAAMEGDYALDADLEQDFPPNHNENNKQRLGGAFTRRLPHGHPIQYTQMASIEPKTNECV